MTKKVSLITGVGPGTGTALVRRFSKNYRVAMLARSEDRLKSLEGEYLNAKGYPSDVSNVDELNASLDFIRNEFSHPSVGGHNAVGRGFGNFFEIDPIVLE